MIPPELAMLAFVPFVLALFASIAPRSAAIYSVLIGMLFLPEAKGIDLPLVVYDKHAAISVATMLGILIFDGAALTRLRFAWYDLFCVALVISPFFSSIENNLGAKDGLAEAIVMATVWGVPYLIGRIYLTDLDAFRAAGIAVVQGGMVYAGLCMLEVALSPQLHRWVYGYHQHSFAQTLRFGGYRPMVFLQHGLAVGSFMTWTTVLAVAFWRFRVVESVFSVPIAFVAGGLGVATIACKSSGALLLLVVGLGVLFACLRLRTALPLLLAIAIPFGYATTRITGLFDGSVLVSVTTDLINEERAQSLDYRISMENKLIDHSLARPILGWGGWNRFRATGENQRDLAVTDGLWIIAFARRGLVGLSMLFATFLIGPYLLRSRYAPPLWSHPAVVPVVALAIVVVLHMIDNIPNGLPSPLAYFVAGGLAGLPRFQPYPMPTGFPVYPNQPPSYAYGQARPAYGAMAPHGAMASHGTMASHGAAAIGHGNARG